MKISKFKKYICWNLISLLGYAGTIIALAFAVMYFLASSQINMRVDLNSAIFEQILKRIILPYETFYKTQMTVIIVLLIATWFEDKAYRSSETFGLRLFSNHEKEYSWWFAFGLILNFSPMYFGTWIFLDKIIKLYILQ
jgi:hypothetical protein